MSTWLDYSAGITSWASPISTTLNYIAKKSIERQRQWEQDHPVYGPVNMPFRRSYRPRRRRAPVRSFRRRYGSRRPTVRRLATKVSALSKALSHDAAKHTNKFRDSTAFDSDVRECEYEDFGGLSVTGLETALSQLRYYDPATPGTLVTAPVGTGTFQREVHVTGVYHSLEIRNNYQVPCKITIYALTPKQDTS